MEWQCSGGAAGDLQDVLALLLRANDWLVGSFSDDTLPVFGGNDTLDGDYGADL